MGLGPPSTANLKDPQFLLLEVKNCLWFVFLFTHWKSLPTSNPLGSIGCPGLGQVKSSDGPICSVGAWGLFRDQSRSVGAFSGWPNPSEILVGFRGSDSCVGESGRASCVSRPVCQPGHWREFRQKLPGYVRASREAWCWRSRLAWTEEKGPWVPWGMIPGLDLDILPLLDAF